jgi:hypothetical protein
MTTKLSDLQLILLSTACQREGGSVLPPPDSVGNHMGRIRMATTALIKRGLVEERECATSAQAWREEGEIAIGVVITDAGRAAIDPQEEIRGVAVGSESTEPEALIEVVFEPVLPGTRPPTKQSLVLEILKRDGGAMLSDIVEATGWLPHTSRAALTGLRKKGHAIVTEKVDGKTRYHVGVAA